MEGLSKNNRGLIAGILAVMICAIAIGYAALSANLTITGTSEITGTWDMKFTGIVVKSKSATVTPDPEHTGVSGTTATFTAAVSKPGDTITYKVTIQNNGNIAARLNTLTTSKTGNATITYNITSDDGVVAGASGTGTVFNAGVSKTINVTITYPSTETSLPGSTNRQSVVTVTAGFVQA